MGGVRVHRTACACLLPVLATRPHVFVRCVCVLLPETTSSLSAFMVPERDQVAERGSAHTNAYT